MSDDAAPPGQQGTQATLGKLGNLGWLRIIVRLVLGLSLLGAVLWFLLEAGGTPHLRFVAWAWGVGMVGSVLANAVTSRRWQLLSETMTSTRLPYGVYFHHLAYTRVLSQFLPSLVVDLVGRSASLRAAGSSESMGRLLAPLVLERVLDLVLPAVLLGWALAWRAGGLDEAAAWSSLVALVVVFSLVSIASLRLMVVVALRVRRWIRRERDAIEVPAVDRPLALRVTMLSLARYATIMLQYWGGGAGLGVTLSAMVLLSSAPLAQLAGLIGITPGALGLQEGGWAGALTVLGVAPADIAVFVIATRGTIIVNFALITVLSWRWRVPPAAAAAPVDAAGG